ncbi:MAG: helix-turn-helix transcriptional regulator [Acidimicrobiales bacterium]
MSQDGQSSPASAPTPSAMVVATFPMAPGTRFNWHTHRDHQLAWASSGVLTVVTGSATWVLPPTRALWIPAELPHETRASGRALMRTLYVRPELCPIAWTEPTPVAARQLLAELIAYLEDETLEPARRVRAETVLVDLLEPVAMATIHLRLPVEERARDVAQGLSENPADKRTLDEWGREVGASGRTLARAFSTDTGVPFGRWRTQLRLQAALQALASGESVSNVARLVGYDTASALVAAFRRETGLTPAMYFKDVPVMQAPPSVRGGT